MSRYVIYPQTDDPDLNQLIDQMKEIDAKRDALQQQINERQNELRRQRMEPLMRQQAERRQAELEGRDPWTLQQEATREQAARARGEEAERAKRRKQERDRLAGW